jgi:CrcB protein
MPHDYEPYLLIAFGGFVGACMRYALNEVVSGMPGILLINVLGCYILGLLMYESIYIGAFSPQTRLVCGVGFVGAFTTFSTFSLQTFEASPVIGMANILASLVLGFVGIYLGRMTSAMISGRHQWKR